MYVTHPTFPSERVEGMSLSDLFLSYQCLLMLPAWGLTRLRDGRGFLKEGPTLQHEKDVFHPKQNALDFHSPEDLPTLS